MSSSLIRGLLGSLTIIFVILTSVMAYAASATYTYDALNRLIRAEYEDGTVIQYTYDGAGNRTALYVNTTPPVTTASPPGGFYNSAQSVSLTCTDLSGAGCDKIYYTTDGSTPSTASPVYSSPINISVSTTLKFFAKDLAGNSESVKTHVYTIDTTPPTNPTSCTESQGAVDNTWQSTVNAPVFAWSGASDSGSGIYGYYWYFGTDPNADPTTWTTNAGCTPSAVSTGIYYLRVKTKDNAGNVSSSPITLFTFKYDGTLPSTTASPVGGSFGSAQSVTLSCTDSDSGCDKIYYTTDGSTPTTSSAVYSSPINISGTTTLKFFAKDFAGNEESIKTEVYTIDVTAPTTTASPTGGNYNSAQSVTLTCTDGTGSGCDQIYYTIDGTTPTTSSPVYVEPIYIILTTTLKFFAKDLAGNSESVKTETYTIDWGGGCSNPPVRIDGTFYATLQSAYNAAVSGKTIKCRDVRFTENLTVNQNITVTLEGGYDCNYTTNTGNTTRVKGMTTTTVGGGTITIRNFILEK